MEENWKERALRAERVIAAADVVYDAAVDVSDVMRRVAPLVVAALNCALSDYRDARAPLALEALERAISSGREALARKEDPSR